MTIAEHVQKTAKNEHVCETCSRNDRIAGDGHEGDVIFCRGRLLEDLSKQELIEALTYFVKRLRDFERRAGFVC